MELPSNPQCRTAEMGGGFSTGNQILMNEKQRKTTCSGVEVLGSLGLKEMMCELVVSMLLAKLPAQYRMFCTRAFFVQTNLQGCEEVFLSVRRLSNAGPT